MTNFDKKSFYRKTDKSGFYLGYYEPISFTPDRSDYYYVIPTEYDLKPGLLAYDLYGDAQLLWVFSVYNRDIINDPLFDFRAGKIIKIPTRQRLNSLL